MKIQEIINNFMSADLPIQNLANSAAEFVASKSSDFIKKMNAVSISCALDDVEQVDDYLQENNLLESIITTSDGAVFSLRELCTAVNDVQNNIEEATLTAKNGDEMIVADIVDDLNEQYVTLVGMSASLTSIANSTIDESSERVNISFADFMNRAQAGLGTLSGSSKQVLLEYYNYATNMDIPVRDRISGIVNSIMAGTPDYHENDEGVNPEFYHTDSSFNGLSPWAAWCSANNISWNSTFNVIKGALAVAGVAIGGALLAIVSIAKRIWKVITKPFAQSNVLIENSNYTNNYMDVPIGQGYFMLKGEWGIVNMLDDTPSSSFTPKPSMMLHCDPSKNNNNLVSCRKYFSSLLNISEDQVDDYLTDWFKHVTDDGLVAFETEFFRVVFWRNYDEVDGIVPTDESPMMGFIINLSLTSYNLIRSTPTRMKAGLFSIRVAGNLADTATVLDYGYEDVIQYYSHYDRKYAINAEDDQQNFFAVLSALFNTQVFLGTSLLSMVDDNWDDIFAASTPGSTINFNRGNAALPSLQWIMGGTQWFDNISTQLEFIGPVVQYVTGDDLSRSNPSNADFLRVVNNGLYNENSLYKWNSGSTPEDTALGIHYRRSAWIICSVFAMILNAKLSNTYIPYRHISSLGKPRYSLAPDNTDGTVLWIMIAAVLALALTIVVISFAIRRHKRRKIAKLQGQQWHNTEVLSSLDKKDANYSRAVSDLARVNRRLARVERISDAIDSSAASTLSKAYDIINTEISDIGTNVVEADCKDILNKICLTTS